MLKRLRWLTLGTVLGVVLCLWVLRTARTRARQLTPAGVAGQVSAGARSLFDDLRAAVREGRTAMREREAELRAELDAARAAESSLPGDRPALRGDPSLN